MVELAKMNWSTKFEKVIGLSDIEILKGYKYLKTVSSYVRNPITHGFLTHKMTEASFYFREIRQRIPINIFNSEIIHTSSQKLDLSKLDRLLADIKSNPQFSNAMAYLAHEELDISYDPASIKEYKTVSTMGRADLEEYLETKSWEVNNYENMDW